MGLLQDKVVLVSGGSQGVGVAIARAAAREGATVAISARRPAPAEALVAELTAAGRIWPTPNRRAAVWHA
jgi:NAD(P)-dependent dehydrogenase (short-subunit alcohol dehydrogenase family)